jgi:ABC-type lipoprotein release transport system permease subunit
MGTAQVLKSLLYGVEAMDLRSLALAGIVLCIVAISATTGPALRASRTDSAEVIRADS